MKLKSALILLSMATLCVNYSHAQDASNFAETALQLSQTNPGGTARILGLGEAQTALGGDISAASSNPAGLGFFNKSVFSFTPAFNYLNSSSQYLGNEISEGRLNFNFGNLGAAIKNSNGSGKFKGGAFGISINRVADFQNQIRYEGYNSNAVENGEIIFDPNRPADFVEYAALSSYVDNNGNIGFDNDFAELAYETFLISPFQDGDGNYFVDRDYYATDDNGNLITDGSGNPIPAYSEPNFQVYQSETIDSRGAAYQTSIAYGGNYDDRLYFGGNIGILTMTRRVEREYIERPTNADLNNLILEDNYEQNGTGISATFGLIGRPINTLLVGLSYTTPSYYVIEQIRDITLTANYAGNVQESYGYDYEPFDYVVTTPSKVKLGATYFFGKLGFITGDIEKVNYAGANLSNPSAGQSFSGENSIINDYNSTINYRLGAEFRYEMFRFRGGVSVLSDPIEDNVDQGEIKFNFGGGIRTEDFFADLTILTTQGKESLVSPYPGQEAVVKNQNGGFAFTLGFFF
jgi:hypothetical protein